MAKILVAERQVRAQGRRSVSVGLPAEVTRAVGLEPTDTVYIYRDTRDKRLVILSPEPLEES